MRTGLELNRKWHHGTEHILNMSLQVITAELLHRLLFIMKTVKSEFDSLCFFLPLQFGDKLFLESSCCNPTDSAVVYLWRSMVSTVCSGCVVPPKEEFKSIIDLFYKD